MSVCGTFIYNDPDVQSFMDSSREKIAALKE